MVIYDKTKRFLFLLSILSVFDVNDCTHFHIDSELLMKAFYESSPKALTK